MTLVIDASVLVAALIDTDTEGSWAENVIANDNLFAPELLLIETCSALRRLEQTRLITRAQADLAFQDMRRLRVQLIPTPPLLARIWELRDNCSSYDASYVASAELLGVALATLDRRLAKIDADCEFLTLG